MTSIHSIDFETPDATQVRVEVALAMPPGALRDATLYALRELKAHVAYNHEDPSNWSGLEAAMEQVGADVLLFDLTCVNEPALTKSLGAIKSRLPHVKIIAAYPYDDPARIMLAMRAGASEFVHAPIGPALTAAFKRITHSVAPTSARRGKVIGFVSAKGGCGATTAACHIAANLKRQTGKEVLLAEFDITAGPLNFLMGTRGQYSVSDAFDSSVRLDAKLWSALIERSRTGVFVLPAPTRSLPGDCQIERVRQMTRFMRAQHDWIMLDFGRGINPLLAAAAQELDELFLITTADIPSLHMAESVLRALPDVLGDVPVRLVLNRSQKAQAISIDEIQRILGQTVYAAIPDDAAALHLACANNTMPGPESALGECFARIAMRLAGETEPAKRKRFRLW